MFKNILFWITFIINLIRHITTVLTYKIKMLKHRPRMWWNKSHIREDEFHTSLDFDSLSYMDMNTEDRQRYMHDLVRRRNVAHYRDLEK